MPDDFNAEILNHVQHDGCGIGRAIINNNELKIPEGLKQHALNGSLEINIVIEGRHNNGHLWHGQPSFSA
ncbi:hypothetical protein D3C75_1056080 [compost metagenome]